MDQHPIAIIDSGLGGLSVYQQLARELPSESTIYLADHAFFPYGDLTHQQINRRLIQLVDWLIAKRVKLIVIACNTITVNAIKNLRLLYSVPFVGTEPAIKPALKKFRHENILVLVTKASFISLKNQPQSQLSNIELLNCSGLADKIEQLASAPKSLVKTIQQYLKKAKKPFTALVLGSTHYVLAKSFIKKAVPPGVMVIESTEPVCQQVKNTLFKLHLNATKPTQHLFYSTKLTQQIQSAASVYLPKSNIIFTRCKI